MTIKKISDKVVDDFYDATINYLEELGKDNLTQELKETIDRMDKNNWTNERKIKTIVFGLWASYQ